MPTPINYSSKDPEIVKIVAASLAKIQQTGVLPDKKTQKT